MDAAIRHQILIRGEGATASKCVVNGQTRSRGDREIVRGWSAASLRRFESRLQRVPVDWIEGRGGYSVTLTIGEVPAAGEWAAWIGWCRQWLYDRGLAAVWCVEWQERKAPHIHLFLVGGTPRDCVGLTAYWRRVTTGEMGGQWISSPGKRHKGGWLKYVAKHGARSLRHYQRSPDSIPPHWEGQSTGRMWGFIGRWKFGPERVWRVDARTWFSIRRRLRRYWRSSGMKGSHGWQAWDVHRWLFRGFDPPPLPG